MYLVPFLVAVGLLLPFLNKAYTIDDTLFLLQAKQGLKTPLHPTAFDVVWDRNVSARCSQIMPSGPVQAYLLMPAVAADSEIVAHGVQLFILCLGLFGTIRLARAIGLSPARSAFAATVVAVSPCVAGMANTVMPDVPAMSFGVLAIDAAIRSRASKHWLHAIGACVFCALAALSRPHAIAFVGIVFVVFADSDENKPWWKGIQWGWRATIVPLTAIALVVLYNTISRDPTAGGSMFSATQKLAGWDQPERHFVASLSHWAITTPIVLLFVLHQRSKLDWYLVAIVVIPISAVVIAIGYEKQSWIGVAASLSVAMLVGMFRRPPTLPPQIHLALAGCLLMPLPLLLYVHLPPKYMVTSVPAAAVLLATSEFDERIWKAYVVGSLAVLIGYLGISIQILRADAAFADLGRRAAAEMIRPLLRDGETVWFTGHWGFQWYALREGAVPLTLNDVPSPRDYLVGPTGNYDGGPVAERFGNKHLVNTLPESHYHLFTMKHGAGFYSDWWGLLPFTSGSSDLETFSLWRFHYQNVDP